MNLEALIRDDKSTVVDVRTHAEFIGGHVQGSINIPLQEIPQRLDELMALSRPLILCCASGNRSGQAENWLKNQGIDEVYNAGSWMDVNYAASKA